MITSITLLSNDAKKTKKFQEQNKAGIAELADSSDFLYNLETKTARKALKTGSIIRGIIRKYTSGFMLTPIINYNKCISRNYRLNRN